MLMLVRVILPPIAAHCVELVAQWLETSKLQCASLRLI